MFIGIAGPICSGKHSIAKWLVTTRGFTLLSLKGTEHYGFNALHFNTPKDLLFYVTKNWIDNFVTCDIDNHKILELYRKRPFFLLLAVDSPITMRYQRCIFERETSMASDEDDDYNTATSIYEIMSLADICIANSYLSLPPLYSYLLNINITDPDRLRPTWDTTLCIYLI
ncbi:unnamed protein product [Rhizophagus irregularis]|nr:unnamed protein product [Rhizophagus irregularis]